MATLTNNNYVNFGMYKKTWKLVIHNGSRNSGVLNIGNLYLPKEFIGKRVRLKVEVIGKDDEK